jgi:hypothetical protein
MRHPDATSNTFLARQLRIWLLLVCVGWLGAAEPAAIVLLDRLVGAAYLPGATAENFQKPNSEQLLAWEQLFSDLLANAVIPGATLFPEQVQRADGLGYQLAIEAIEGQDFWLLREQVVLGGGFYLIRPGGAEPLFIQAPHMRNDKHSERCAVRAFWTSQARAAAFSTISRSTLDPRPGQRYGDTDLSHQEHCFLTSATRAAARTLPSLVVVQFHGFDSEARDLGARSLVLSNGTRRPDPEQLAFAHLLDERWAPVEALIYPDDITVLGGLLNTQGSALMRFPQHRFLHLELSPQLRQELLEGEPALFDLRAVPAAVSP